MKRLPVVAAPLDIEQLVEILAPRVAELVLAQIAGALGCAQDPFTTRSGGPVPSEFRRRAKLWRTVAPTIPGAVRIGRWVTVPRAAYAAWVASHTTTAPSPQTGPAIANCMGWEPMAALRAVGLRPTR